MTIWFWVVLAVHAMGLLSSITAVMTSRTSQGAVAWAISLNTCPWVAVPAYWILGRNRFQGYETARTISDQNVQAGMEALAAAVSPFQIPASDVGSGGEAAE